MPGDAHPMDVLRTGCSLLGNLEPERDFDQLEVADRLLAAFPSMLLYWWHFHADGRRIETVTDDDSVAGHFLHLLHGQPPSEFHRRVLDVSLILYAEHEFNASTFTARVIAATLSDFHSAITGAIGALARPAARRRQRGGDGTDRALRQRGGGGPGRARDARGQGEDHGLRPSRLHDLRSAQQGHQGFSQQLPASAATA
jgi:hypothetical protein